MQFQRYTSTMPKQTISAYQLAQKLMRVDGIDNVRADAHRITVVHVPDNKSVVKIPETVHTTIHEYIQGTDWETDYKDPGRNAEKHTITGGRRHNCIELSRNLPHSSELQYHLVNWSRKHKR